MKNPSDNKNGSDAAKSKPSHWLVRFFQRLYQTVRALVVGVINLGLSERL